MQIEMEAVAELDLLLMSSKFKTWQGKTLLEWIENT